MTRAFHHLLLVIATTLALSTANVSTVWSKKIAAYDISGWNVGAYSDDKTGRFSHCAADGDYENGITLFVIFNSSREMALMFGRNDWRMNTQKHYSIEYRYDQNRWSTQDAIPIDEKVFAINFGTNPADIEAFKAAYDLEILVGRQTFGFGLKGTRKLMDGLENCVWHHGGDRPPSSKENGNSSSSGAESENETTASGTGILITSSGQVLTNNHVVEGCSTITTTLANDIPRRATVVKADKSNDLALLQLASPPTNIVPATFRGKPVRAGESIAVFGFPLSGTLSSSGNIVTGNITSLAGMNDDARLFQISAPIQPGNSGGPLLDMSGNVIGIVTSKLDELVTASKIGTLPQNVNFAIKGDIAESFMQAYSVDYSVSTSSGLLPTPEVLEVARKFTVQVLCNP